MADENELEVKIVLDDGSIKQGFLRLKKQGQETSDSLSQSFGKIGKNIVRNFVGIGAAFASFQGLKAVVGNLRDFQKAMAEINTITDISADKQKQLQTSLINLSAQFGTKATDQAKSYYQIISAGVTDAAKANELLIASNKLAIGGLASTSSSIDILTSAVNAFGQENLSAKRASDILFGTVRLGKTTVSELSSSLGQILPTSAALGVSFEDTNAALAALTTRGVSTSEAVTQLNAVFTAVLKKQEAAKKLGPEVAKAFNLQALKTKGLSDFLKDLNKVLGGSEEKLTKLLGRAEGARAIITLAGDNFKGLEKNVRDLANSTGAADDAFKKINETLDQKINRTVATTESIFLKLANSSNNILTHALSAVNTQLEDINSSFESFNGLGSVIVASILNIEDSFVGLVISIVESLSAIPVIGKKIFGDFNTGILGTLNERRQEIAEAIVSLGNNEAVLEGANAAGKEVGKKVVKGMTEEMKAIAGAQKFTLGDGFTSLVDQIFPPSEDELRKQRIALTLDQIQNLEKQARESFVRIGKMARDGLGRGLGAGFAAFGKALVTGENALEAFGKALLGAIGQSATATGTEMILKGIGYTFDPLYAGFGPPLIAAGAGLAAFGGVLSALGSGGNSVPTASGAAGGGGSLESGPTDTGELVDTGPTNSINVNIAGDVLDSDDTGLRIVKLLQSEIDKSGPSSLQVT